MFGAHLGFDAALRARHTCVFVNLEQLGTGGAAVSSSYLALLGQSAVVDYDADNVGAYTAHADDVPLISFAHAPYLANDGLDIEARPIDILFFGSMNDRRAQLIEQIEASGRGVTLPSGPLYGPERDELVKQARAVFNCHFYESSRFEQARAFQCLSLGTPVISERSAGTLPPPQFEDAIFWVGRQDLGGFFADHFGTAAFAQQARRKLNTFQHHDVIEQYADALAFASGYRKVQAQRMDPGPWRPTLINIGSGKDYHAGWLNLDIIARTEPDLLLNLAEALALPLRAMTPAHGELLLEEGSVDLINANNVLEHVPDLVALMGNCLKLLKLGGEFRIEVPYEHARSAWQDPTHVRALNENSWIYYTDWFWYLGWYEYRFQIVTSSYLDERLQPCEQDKAAFMSLTLRKIQTTSTERMHAQAMQPQVRLPDDPFELAVAPSSLHGALSLHGSAMDVNR